MQHRHIIRQLGERTSRRDRDESRDDYYATELHELTKSSLSRTRNSVYLLCAVILFAIFRLIVLHWSTNRADLFLERSRQNVLATAIAEIDTLMSNPNMIEVIYVPTIGPLSLLSYKQMHLDTLTEKHSSLRRILEESSTRLASLTDEIRKENLEVPLIGVTLQAEHLPFLISGLIPLLIFYLAHNLKRLQKLAHTWRIFLIRNERIHDVSLLRIRFFIYFPFFGRKKDLLFTIVLCLSAATLVAFCIDEIDDFSTAMSIIEVTSMINSELPSEIVHDIGNQTVFLYVTRISFLVIGSALVVILGLSALKGIGSISSSLNEFKDLSMKCHDSF